VTVLEARPVVRRRNAHLPGLDGLRGVAVATVVAYHLGFLPGGFVGVDLFFVLSGFLITTLLLERTPSGAADLRRWWGRRIRRLTPAVAVVVAAVLVAFAATTKLAWDAVATMTWWQNWHLIIEGAAYWDTHPSPLRHAWSLSIEEQFYLAWPLVLVASVAVARRVRRDPAATVAVVAAVLSIASFAWAAHLASIGTDLSRVYFGTDTRAGALLLGCAAGAAVSGRPRSTAPPALTAAAVASVLGIAALVVTLTPDALRTYTGGLLAAAIGSLVLVLAAASPGPVSRALSVPALRWVGVRSYAIYLWSWPTQLFVQDHAPDASRWQVALVVVPVAVALAALSLRLVEAPLRLSSGWATPVGVRRAAWIGGATVLVVLVASVALSAPPAPAG
jgi:peptidoglycan/LPS O-acetylase OafA/YrhL